MVTVHQGKEVEKKVQFVIEKTEKILNLNYINIKLCCISGYGPFDNFSKFYLQQQTSHHDGGAGSCL